MYQFKVISVFVIFFCWTNVHGFTIRTKRSGGNGCQFHEAAGFALYGHNDRTYADSTLPFCKQQCLNDDECLSIDFNSNTHACFISFDSRDTAPNSYGRHSYNTYYHKYCGHNIDDWDPAAEELEDGSGVDIGAEVIYKEGRCVMKYGPYGGKGGKAFNDVQYFLQHGNITGVHIRFGMYIDGLGFKYGNTEVFHGNGLGGDKSIIVPLQADEYITGVQGRIGSFFDQLSFVTNKRVLGPYGSNGGDPFSINSDGRQLAYIGGKDGQLLDQLDAYFHC